MESKGLVFGLAVWLVFYVIALGLNQILGYLRRWGADGSATYLVYIVFLLLTLFILTYLLIKKSGISFLKEELTAIGAMWVILTLIVSFLFGVPWGGRYWHRLVSLPQISIGDGGLILLVAQLLAPITTKLVVDM
ncbi:MAG: hypothetical protein ACOC89_02175 [Candidatus Saliniplasma sp.]